jgi:hypothetical protein
MEMEVYVDTHHIRWRHLYVMPLVSTFMDEEKMDDCIRKGVEWCEVYPHTGGPERAVLPYKYILARIRCSYEHTCPVYRTYTLRHNH